MRRKVLVKRMTTILAAAAFVLSRQALQTTFAEEDLYTEEAEYEDYLYDEGFYDEEYYADDSFDYFDDGEYYYAEGDEYYDDNGEEYYIEGEENCEEEDNGWFHPKCDPEYGPDEFHYRSYPEDGYRFRKNPEESSFYDFDILTKEDAQEQFHLLSYDELPDKVELDVPEVLQFPELPTGCESVSLTMALRYEGFDLIKTEIAAEFLLYNLKDDNAAIGFIGDPFDDSGAGCFPPALAASADNFFIDQGYQYRAFDITGTELEEVMAYVAAGTPVMVWSTMFEDIVSYSGEVAEYHGEEYKWYLAEHCVLVTGYDKKQGTVRVNDPLEGIVNRDFFWFKDIYDQIGKYAVVVKEVGPEVLKAESDKTAAKSLGINVGNEGTDQSAAADAESKNEKKNKKKNKKDSAKKE